MSLYQSNILLAVLIGGAIGLAIRTANYKEPEKPKEYSAFSATTMATPNELSGYGEPCLPLKFRILLRIEDIQEQLELLEKELKEQQDER